MKKASTASLPGNRHRDLVGAHSGADLGVILLAAGQGKRMKSTLPKVLHEVGGLPMLFHTLMRLKEAAPRASVAIVVGHGREKVEEAVRSAGSLFGELDLNFVYQPEQKGTGHAARCAMDSPWGAKLLKERIPVLVLPGDSPLLTTELLTQILQPLGSKALMRLLTTELSDPTGYGRIIRRGKSGPVLRIVEEKDANLREKAIREVGTSIYFFASTFLKAALHRLSDKNAQGEYYLTDCVSQAAKAKAKGAIEVLNWSAPEDLRGVNDLWELSQAARVLNDRQLKRLAKQGVRVLDPASTWVDVTVEVGEGSSIHPGVILSGKTQIGSGVLIGPRVVLKDVIVQDRAQIKTGTVAEASQIGPDAQVGPYAHLRPESDVGSKAKIGNFVELKKTKIGSETSVAHLSYLGDAVVGQRVNIGCGFVTCNFDGRTIDGSRKHRTIIEDDVFMGSDCQTIAPVRVGSGAYVASGSTITDDVEAGALAIARTRQVTKPGYAKKLKSR